MAHLALEKAPFSAIFSLPILGGGQPGPRAENREWGQREAWWPLPSRDDEHHV
jgi:hypothetical protein